MARIAQVLLLFMVAVCAVQGASHSGRRSYGRSRSRHHEPRDYYSKHHSKHGSASKRPNSFKVNDPSNEKHDESVTPSVTDIVDNIIKPINGIPGNLGDDQDNGKTINVDGASKGSDDHVPDEGNISVVGLTPNSDGDNDNTNKPDVFDDNVSDGGNSINVEGMNPDDKDDFNSNNVVDIDNVGEKDEDTDDSLPDNDQNTPDLIPGTIDVNGMSPDDSTNGPSDDSDNINIDGADADDMPNDDVLPKESDENPGEKDDGHVIIIDNDGLTPPGDDGKPNTGFNELPGNVNEHPDHNTNDMSHGVNEDKPKHDNNFNINDLLPGGDGQNPEHGNIDNGGLTSSGKPHHNSVHGGGPKATGHKPNTNNLNHNRLPSGGDAGGQTKFPNIVKPVRPNGSNKRPSHPGGAHGNNNNSPSGVKPGNGGQHALPGHNVFIPQIPINVGDQVVGNEQKNNSFVMPVYLPGPNGQVILPSGFQSQNGKVPAFFIVMINGQATLVKNPAASGVDENIDLNAILAGLSIGSMSNGNGLLPSWLHIGEGIGSGIGSGIGVLPSQPIVIGSHYPHIGGFNIGTGIPGGSIIINGLHTNEPPVITEPVIEQVPVPVQPSIITEPIIQQPIYNFPIPPPMNPGVIGYPAMPYPFPWASGWDNMSSNNMNWPSIINFLLNLGANFPNNGGNNGDNNLPDNGGKVDNKPPVKPEQSKDEVDDDHNNHESTDGSDVPSGNKRPGDANTEKPVTPSGKFVPPEETTETNVIYPTRAPPTEPTRAPPTEPTQAPSTEPTRAPPTESTSAPATKPTQAPPTEPTRAPPTEPTPAPTTEPTQAPPTEPTPPPATEPTYNTPTEPSYSKPTLPTHPDVVKPTEPNIEHYNDEEDSGEKGSSHKPQNPDLSKEHDSAERHPPNNRPTNPGDNNIHIHYPLNPDTGAFDPTLINLLNVVLKVPNKGSNSKTKPAKDTSKDSDSLMKILASLLKPSGSDKHNHDVPNHKPHLGDKSINELLAILKSNDGDKALKDLIALLKSNSGDKPLKDLLEILKSNTGDKLIKVLFSILKPNAGDKALHDLLAIIKSKSGDKVLKDLLAILKMNAGDKTSHDLLAVLNQNGNNEPNLAILSQLLLHLLEGHSQPSMNVIVEPGINEAKSNLMLLLNLLAGSLGSEYLHGLGGYYDQMNPSNLYFLGHFPCDYSNIHSLAGGRGGMQQGLWHLLSQMYGTGKLNTIRLERSAEEDEENDVSKPMPKMDEKNN